MENPAPLIDYKTQSSNFFSFSKQPIIFQTDGFLCFDGFVKVDRCMARLQELQYTVAGGTKVISGVSLSPRSTRAYLRTSLRCKQESARYTRICVGFA
jgi:hypothetical protein